VSPADATAGDARRRLLVAVVVAASLIVGFAVAQGTGMRWLGAIVLILGGAWCAVVMWRAVGVGRTAVVAVVYVGAFVVSHPLATAIGTWQAVLVVAAVAAAVAYAEMRPPASRVSRASPPVTSTR
jgi:hypothetical protein